MNIGLIAHDAKKILMQNFAIAYRGILSKHDIYATGTTGRLIEEVTNLNIHKYLAGHLGGVQPVALLQRGGGHPSPVVLPWKLRIVQVAVFPGSNDQGEPLLFRLRDGGWSQSHAPGEDGVSFVVDVGPGPRLFIP